jgi:hypothetical protein
MMGASSERQIAEQEAEERLINAAPMLYGALVCLLDEARERDVTGWNPTVFVAAEMAIYAATGRKP